MRKLAGGETGKRPVNLRDVARAAGCSLAAASLALRNSGRISEAKRREVQEAARRLGYRPNPLAAAFHAEIRRRKGPNYRATLAWVNDSPDAGRWQGVRLLEAAQARAAELGYSLDVVHIDPSDCMDEPGELARRFLRVVKARGIFGVVLPELYRPALAVEEWPEVAVVSIGHYSGSLLQTKVARVRDVIHHTVAPDAAANLSLALRHLEGQGVRRVGLAVTEWWDWVHDHAALGRYLVWAEGLRKAHRIPPFVFATVDSEETRAKFENWLGRWKPEAVLCCNREILAWVKGSGRGVPRDVRVAHLEASWEGPQWSGVDESPERLGAAAVTLLASMLQGNERGTPPWPRKVLVPGVWRAGKTA